MNLQELFTRQHKRIYRMAMLMLKSTADAEDAVQNIFLKYMEKGIEFSDMEHENAWFITVTRNYCKDQLRNFWRRQVDLGDIPEQVAESDTDYELLEHIMKLPDKYRELIYLYYYEEYSVREMSHMLVRKESTIQTQLAAARKRLKKLLSKEDESYEQTVHKKLN